MACVTLIGRAASYPYDLRMQKAMRIREGSATR
jgi:hypothetical protein